MSDCPCGSNRSYDECCAPLINGERQADTAEALMRSRYSAYVKQNIPYLGETLHPKHRHVFDESFSSHRNLLFIKQIHEMAWPVLSFC